MLRAGTALLLLPLCGCFVDVDLSGRACDDEHPCLEAERCVRGSCMSEDLLESCESANDCLAGERCVGDRCVPGDGAPDGGARDAGADDTDAGGDGTDAGEASDAGPLDAGAGDAGDASDAGLRDAGVVDAGTADAGVVDAGDVDAGPVDAGGPIDAGPFCAPLPLVHANQLAVTPQTFEGAAANLQPDTELLLADGTYTLANTLVIDQPRVTLRSASGERGAVVLVNGGLGATDEMIRVLESDVTITAITLRGGPYVGIQVSPGGGAILRTHIHDVHLVDFVEEAIFVNGDSDNAFWTDDGTVSCSRVELTDAVRDTFDCDDLSGIDLRQSRDWVVRDNFIEGIWCDVESTRAGITVQESSRDVVIERNVVLNSRSALQLGDFIPSPGQRTYADDPCGFGPTVPVGAVGLIARNNIGVTDAPALVSATSGEGSSIRVINACETAIVHNTLVSEVSLATVRIDDPQANGLIANNIMSRGVSDDGEQTPGAFVIEGNLQNPPMDRFVDANGLDFHLAPGANAAVNGGVAISPSLRTADFDGDAITEAPDVGVDERTP